MIDVWGFVSCLGYTAVTLQLIEFWVRFVSIQFWASILCGYTVWVWVLLARVRSTRAGCFFGASQWTLTPEPGRVDSRIRRFEWGQLSGSFGRQAVSPLIVLEGSLLCVRTRERHADSSFCSACVCSF